MLNKKGGGNMIRMSLMEKLEMLKDIIVSNSYLFVLFISFIVIAIILLNTKKLNRDMMIKSCIGIYIIMFIFTILEYNKEFYGIIDYLINNIFFNLLFPSIATYAVTIIISNIIIVKSIFDKRTKKIIRKINILVYCFLSLLLFLVLNIIQTKNIDVYSSAAVYTNKELFVLIELNMGVFLAWIICLIGYKVFKKRIKEEFSIEPVNTKFDVIKVEHPRIEVQDTFESFRKPIEEKVENKLNVSLNDYIKDFTLEEYKMLSQMLKERQN